MLTLSFHRHRSVLPFFLLAGSLGLTACSTVDLSVRESPSARQPEPGAPTAAASAVASPPAPPARRPGAYYKDDGPADVIPDGLLETPDAEPRVEPYARGPSKPYVIFGQSYVPITHDKPFIQRGIGSWYGKKFHGQKTASGEIYDMFKMTAAHPTLPIPSYVRVTNLRNGRKVIVRVNDRGPFHSSRIIDLSYTAALKLDYIRHGSAELEVERLLPDEILRMQEAKRQSGADLQAMLAQETTSATPATPAPTAAAAGGGFFLQLGAYSLEGNALAMRDRLLAGWPQYLPLPALIRGNGLYRLQSGPFASREQADAAASQLNSAARIQTTVVWR